MIGGIMPSRKDRFKKIALFCTCGGKSRDTIANMEQLCGKKPLGVFEIIRKDVKKGTYIETLKSFCDGLS